MLGGMSRTARASVGGLCYHVINRGNAGAIVFRAEDDYAAFERLLGEACRRQPMRLLAYSLLPSHFHLVLWPLEDGDLSRWMQWLLTAHVRRYHRNYGTSGHVWQGRFRACPIQQDDHLLTILRYVERNPVRAKLVSRAEQWRWSSAWAGTSEERPPLHDGPVIRPRNWLSRLNQPETAVELEQLRRSVNRGTPFGNENWLHRTAARLGLEATVRPRGRPRKSPRK